MENLTLGQIKTLAQQTQIPAISIFLPTHRAGQDTQQDPIRYKNLLRQAETNLQDQGYGPREIDALLKSARALLDDGHFWRHQRDGLAVFTAPGEYHVHHLPFRVEELLVVARSYYVKPVLPLFTNNGHYFVLAISQNEVRLFEGTRHSIGQIDLPDDMPSSLDEALESDDPEKQLQARSSAAQGGTQSVMFHGHGPGSEEQKERIARYLNLLDAGLSSILREQQAPLVLAGVDYLLPIYRSVSDYANIMQTGITGSPEQLRPDELHERAWPIVEPYFRQQTDSVIEQYKQFSASGKATDSIEEIVAAAYYGRVDRLLLAVDTPVWGRFNPETGKVDHYQAGQSAEDDLALLDFAAMHTLQKDGSVFALSQDELPSPSPAAAILRY